MLIGMGGDKIIPQLVPKLSKEHGLGKKIAEAHIQIFIDKYLAKVKPAPGARKLLLRLKKEGIKLIFASSSGKTLLQKNLKIAKVHDLGIEAVSASHVKASKPEPDIIKQALKQIKLKPIEVLLLGDTPYDIKAAKKCRVDTIAVRCGGFCDKQLKEAIANFDNPDSFFAYLNNPPPRES